MLEKMGAVISSFVALYHMVCGSIFLNIAAQDATGPELWGNYVLSPVHYLFAGKKAYKIGETYTIEQRFDYHDGIGMKTTASIIALPVNLIVGSALKGCGYFYEETRQRHKAIQVALTHVVPHLDVYQELGIDLSAPLIDNETLRPITEILARHRIPFWVASDLAILDLDFDNVMHALSALDSDQFATQDWSPRTSPRSSIRVYVKESHTYIKISILSKDHSDNTHSLTFKRNYSMFIESLRWKA